MTHIMLDLETWGTTPDVAAAFRTKQFSPR